MRRARRTTLALTAFTAASHARRALPRALAGRVERLADDLGDRAELFLGDDERRRDLQRDATERARDHAALERLRGNAVGDLAVELDRAEEPDRTHLAHEVVTLEWT